MANSATLIQTVPVLDRVSLLPFNLLQYKLIIDTDADLTVVSSDGINNVGLFGINYCSADVHDVRIKAGANTLLTYEFGGYQSIDYRPGPLLVSVDKASNFVFRSNVTHNGIILWLGKFPSTAPSL